MDKHSWFNLTQCLSFFPFEEKIVKVTFKTSLRPYYHRKIVRVDFSDENRIG